MSIPHFSKIIFQQAEKYQDRSALFTRNDENKTWNPITWNHFAGQITKAARSLLTLNTQHGDRVGIYTQNMAESFYVDFANFTVGLFPYRCSRQHPYHRSHISSMMPASKPSS